MAKKTENIKKKEKNFLLTLKTVTKWISNPRRTEDQLDEIITKYNIENSIVKRILSYNYGFPYIIKYFNKYLNSLYEFERYDTRLLIKSIVYLMDINNRSNSKDFMYIKSNELKDDVKYNIKKLLKDYFNTIHDIDFNRQDLNMCYKLFKLGVIKDEQLLEIDRLLNGEKTLIKSLNFIDYSDVLKVQDLEIESFEDQEIGVKIFSEEITDFINDLKEKKQLSEKCKACPLFSKTMVTIDTNKPKTGETDVVFIGLNPGKDEAEKDIPFIGDSGRYIRNMISNLPKNLNWVIFNAILCSTSNKNEITAVGSVNDIIRNCSDITNEIFKNFPAKIYIPIGDDAKSVFGIQEKITSASGKIYKLENNITIIPLIHPSAIMRNSKSKAIYDQSVKNIIEYIDPNSKSNKIDTSPSKIDVEMVQDEKGLLLLDIKRLENNQVLMIYTDLAGKKKYKIKKYEFPVLIKNQEWRNCDMITDKINDRCVLNDWEKSNISKKCHQLLGQMVRV